jgi:hypothetical protein
MPTATQPAIFLTLNSRDFIENSHRDDLAASRLDTRRISYNIQQTVFSNYLTIPIPLEPFRSIPRRRSKCDLFIANNMRGMGLAARDFINNRDSSGFDLRFLQCDHFSIILRDAASCLLQRRINFIPRGCEFFAAAEKTQSVFVEFQRGATSAK